ncbi:histidine phosphatase superfamily [Tribonema minus]|uniref:Histidine phosphatase superfamily n=1 Tax=Tribonema minus TaxID=303371 RepID=A0A836C6S8_9STRA|nr:histidine phosphatase superfamily [Tribonema minus]
MELTSLKVHRRAKRGDVDAEAGDTSPLMVQESDSDNASLRAPGTGGTGQQNVDPEWLRRLEDNGERELPRFMRSGWFKSLFILVIVLVALSPIIFKVRRESAELERRRYHNDSFKEKNPNVSSLPADEQWNYYCHASFPGALDTLNYTAPGEATLISVQVITRHGDRAPCNVLPHEVNITWYCDDPDPYDPAFTPVKISHIRDEPPALRPSNLWQQGNCAACDLTGRGLVQHYMLGEALGAIYSQFVAINPNTVYARSTDEARTRQSAEAFIRGLLTVAVEAGTVQLRTGVINRADMLRPQPTMCPALADAFDAIQQSEPWGQNLEEHGGLMTSLTAMLETTDPGFPSGGEWNTSFDHFFDNIQSRHCHGLAMPCALHAASAAVSASERNGTSDGNSSTAESSSSGGAAGGDECVTEEQHLELYEAASWEFRYRFGGTHLRHVVARLGSGALVGQLLENMQAATSSTFDAKVASPAGKDGVFFLYSGHDDTIGGLLSALQVAGWNWPPYASNLIWELWRDDSSSQPFVRVIYNGKVLELPFCSQATCPLQEFRSWLLAHVVPSDMLAECQQGPQGA